MTNYKNSKQELKDVANLMKEIHPTDKPLVRMCINDEVFHLSQLYNLSEREINLLSEYACSLHPN